MCIYFILIVLQSISHYFSYIFPVFSGPFCVALYTSLMNSSHYCSVGFHSQPSHFPCPLPRASPSPGMPPPQSLPLPRAAFSPGLPALVASSSLPPVKCTSVSKMGETSINLNYTGSSPVVEAREGQSRASTGAQEVLPLTCLSWCERRSHSFSVGSAPNKVNC